MLYVFITTISVVTSSTDSNLLNCDLIFDGTCYEHFTQLISWTDANSSCVSWGGELVSLYSQTLINILPNLFNASSWTSANNFYSNFTLKWFNGSRVELTTVNLTSTVCGYLSGNGVFQTSLCNITRSYICSKQGECWMVVAS